jgi:hypothetical protein
MSLVNRRETFIWYELREGFNSKLNVLTRRSLHIIRNIIDGKSEILIEMQQRSVEEILLTSFCFTLGEFLWMMGLLNCTLFRSYSHICSESDRQMNIEFREPTFDCLEIDVMTPSGIINYNLNLHDFLIIDNNYTNMREDIWHLQQLIEREG